MLVLSAATPAHAQEVPRVGSELTEIDGEVAALVREPLRQTTQRSPTYVEERLTDGELFYRLRDYLRASIIFTDIVENHASHRAYPDAMFLLGESLFQARDLLGARTRYKTIIDNANNATFRPFVQRSLGRLIEIAIRIRDFDDVDSYFQRLSQLPPSEIGATTAYFRAKYLYNRAVPDDDEVVGGSATVNTSMLDESRRAFEAVQSGGEYFLQARYFIGVIHTLRGEYPQAIEAFRQVLRTQPETPEQREVTDLTQLALGRLYYETDQLDQAVEAYQAVPRTSSSFDTALYEIAWVYIRLGDSTRAERALEVLSVAAPDSHYIPDAKVLRGNLLLRNGRYGRTCMTNAEGEEVCSEEDGAEEVFRNVRREFGPVYRELEQIRRDHEGNLHSYFRGLVRENMDDFDVNDFLPESARRWVVLEGDFDRALTVLSDLSQARQMVAETHDLILRLNAALTAPSRVTIFPDLRGQREQTTAYRNRLARLRQRLITIEARQNPAAANGELGQVRERRRRIERALGGMPTSDDDFISRDDQLLNRYRRLNRDLNEMRVEVMGLEARIVATERFVADTAEQQDNLDAVRAELRAQQSAVEQYREQIEQLERGIEVGRIQVGVGDVRYQRDDRLRDEYRRLIDRERELSGGGRSETDRLFSRITGIESQLDTRDRQIDQVVSERVANMERVIAEESQKLDGYRAAIASLEGETEEVVGAVTYENFNRVRDRFYDLVLRADVGLIDVAWARREEHRSRVDMLTRERSRDIQALDDEFRDIMDESTDDEGEE